MRDSLKPEEVQQALKTTWLGRAYRYVAAVGSTNDVLKAEESNGDGASNAAGTVLLTDYQERGRGRLARSWEAPPGSSLLFSILLRPGWPVERLSWLTMICGLAVSEAVEQQSGLKTYMKWPNDNVLEHENKWQKYGGILLEGGISKQGALDYVVAGMGINVNIPAGELPRTSFPATSLLVVNGRPLSRLDLFCAILSRFEEHYDRAGQGVSPHAAWQERLIYMNERVLVSRLGQGVDVAGQVIGTDTFGQLQIRDDLGAIHHIAAGDMILRPYLEQ
jgi:BirA family biotin operon repressor/biotin-[acetyl-CoA-carboxylase] ligase